MIMDEVFEKNRLRPTDPDYQYDKQVDFSCHNKVKSGWDDDEADEELVNEDKKGEEVAENVTKQHATDSVFAGDVVEDDKIETFDGNDDEDYFW